MENQRFDSLSKAISMRADRRRLVAGAGGVLVATLLGAIGLGASVDDAAAAACKRNGKECRRGGQCCSGVCKKKCRPAPQQGTCTIKKDTCKLTGGIGFGPKCNGVASCECIRTKRGAAFCRQIGGAACTFCTADLDCETALGPNAKCINAETCGDPCGIGDFCAVPCGFANN